MKGKSLVILAGIILIIQACSTTHTINISAIESDGQELIDINGIPSIASQKNHLVSLGLYKYRFLTDYSEDYSAQYWYEGNRDLDNLAAFNLTVKNIGVTPITISSENVTVQFTQKTRTQNLPIISAQLLLKKLESAESSARSSLIAWSGLITNVTGSAQFGKQDAEKRLEKILKDQKLVEEAVLKPQTVNPGDSVAGLIACDTQDLIGKKDGDFHIVVSVGDEQHSFNFKYFLTADSK